MPTETIPAAIRRVVRATIEDGQRSTDNMADAVDDLLTVGIEPMLLMRTLECPSSAALTNDLRISEVRFGQPAPHW